MENAPTAAADTLSMNHDMGQVEFSQNLLTNDSDPEGDSITAVLDSTTSHGTASLASNGTLTYEPDPAFVGDDTLYYHATDGLLDSSSTKVTIHVVNHAPIGVADSTYTVAHDQLLSTGDSGVLANDTDTESDTLTAILDTDVSHGTLTLYGSGLFQYQPNKGYVGNDAFYYHASDGIADSSTTKVSISVTNTARLRVGLVLVSRPCSRSRCVSHRSAASSKDALRLFTIFSR